MSQSDIRLDVESITYRECDGDTGPDLCCKVLHLCRALRPQSPGGISGIRSPSWSQESDRNVSSLQPSALNYEHWRGDSGFLRDKVQPRRRRLPRSTIGNGFYKILQLNLLHIGAEQMTVYPSVNPTLVVNTVAPVPYQLT